MQPAGSQPRDESRNGTAAAVSWGNMSAQSTWERLERDQWSEVERWLAEHEAEGLHLDFKEKGKGSSALDEHDLGRVSKALSAFANVEGGVLVLGVRAEATTKGDPDRVVSVPGVPEAEKALAVLDRRLQSLTDPPIAGARVIAVHEGNGAGRSILAVLAPQSDGGPHRATVGKDGDRYFIRIASNSLPAPHAVLAGMFGRRPQPRLRLAVARDASGAGSVFIRNHGRGLARDVLVRISIGDEHKAQMFGALAHNEGWPRSTPTRFRGAPVYGMALRGQSPVHALDTAKIGVFSQQDPNARLFIRARIDADGVEPVLIRTTVRLNGGHVVDVPAVGEPGHDEIEEEIA